MHDGDSSLIHFNQDINMHAILAIIKALQYNISNSIHFNSKTRKKQTFLVPLSLCSILHFFILALFISLFCFVNLQIYQKENREPKFPPDIKDLKDKHNKHSHTVHGS